MNIDKILSLAAHGAIEPHRLDKIIHSPEVEGIDREKLLGSIRVNPNTLEHFGTHGSDYEKEAVSSNPATPVHVLEKLARHPSDDIKVGIAVNTAAPKHVLMSIDHSRPHVAQSILYNSATPKEKVEEIANHYDQFTASMAKSRLEKMK